MEKMEPGSGGGGGGGGLEGVGVKSGGTNNTFTFNY